MAMLAEPRRRQRIGPNPRGKFFSEDEDNRGRNLLQKLGWKDGDGLGAQKHGMVEPIRPKIQMNSNGLGFDIKRDPWMAHSKEFAAVLENLQTAHGGSEDNKEDVRAELETKSKHSRSRIHYHKFTRGKDLSSITSKDWTCIFGNDIRLALSVESNSEVVFSSRSPDESAPDACDVSGAANGEYVKPTVEDLNTVNMGSMHDYFKMKMAKKLDALKQKSIKIESEDSPSPSPEKTSSNESVPEAVLETVVSTKKEKKRKNRKHRIKIVPEDSSSPVIDEETSVCMSVPEAVLEIVVSKKKTKKRKQTDTALESVDDDTNPTETSVEKKEKKRRTKLKPKVEEVEEESDPMNEVREKKKARFLSPEDTQEVNPEVKSSDLSKLCRLGQHDSANEENVKPVEEGLKFVNKGSMHDYFKMKMAKKLDDLKQKSIKIEPEDSPSSSLEKTSNESVPEAVLETVVSKKKTKKRKQTDTALESVDDATTINPTETTLEKKEKKHRTKLKPKVEEVEEESGPMNENKEKKHRTKLQPKVEEVEEESGPMNENKEKKDRTKLQPKVEEVEKESGPMNEVWEKKKARFLAPEEIREVHAEFKGSNLSKIRGYGLY